MVDTSIRRPRDESIFRGFYRLLSKSWWPNEQWIEFNSAADYCLRVDGSSTSSGYVIFGKQSTFLCFGRWLRKSIFGSEPKALPTRSESVPLFANEADSAAATKCCPDMNVRGRVSKLGFINRALWTAAADDIVLERVAAGSGHDAFEMWRTLHPLQISNIIIWGCRTCWAHQRPSTGWTTNDISHGDYSIEN